MIALHRRGIACVYQTVRSIVNDKQDARHGRATTSRFALRPLSDKVARLPAIDSEAMRNLRTLYPTTVRASGNEAVLKAGFHSSKIGGEVIKGPWRGMPIFTLTLEERATCPVSCRHLRSCYGNTMHFARRFIHGEQFERHLVENVVTLVKQYPYGFVIRLHVLGDFYSVRYVNLWRVLIESFPQVHVFGYTSRYDDDIGVALCGLVTDHWHRFAVRFSNAPDATMPATLSIELPVQRPADSFICPQQTGGTESCSTCAACWSTTKRVCFLQH